MHSFHGFTPFPRKGFEAFAPDRSPDSWIVATVPPSHPCDTDSGFAVAKRDGPPHLQWRGPAGPRPLLRPPHPPRIPGVLPRPSSLSPPPGRRRRETLPRFG